MNWCVTSEVGTSSMANDMNFVIPFKNAVKSDNVFVRVDFDYTIAGRKPVTWNFLTMPSEQWKNALGEKLTKYATNPTDNNWGEVKSAFVDGWRVE